VNNSKRSETADPDRRERAARPRGRPPLSAEEAKRSPLTIRATKAEKDELLRAGKAAGRSLAEEIKFRLGAVRARPATEGEDDFEQILAGLDQVMDLAIDLQIALDEIENWVYFSIIALRKATGAGGQNSCGMRRKRNLSRGRPTSLPFAAGRRTRTSQTKTEIAVTEEISR
jgi:hypothetical protein